jgi:hypothetical protein
MTPAIMGAKEETSLSTNQNDEDQKAGLVVVRIEQRLQEVAHNMYLSGFAKPLNRGWLTA